ncbi:MAG: hypothetical protein ABSA13_04690 [Beijerinckiaceae bacterium]
MRPDPSGIPALNVEGDHDRIIALVAATTRRIPPGLTGHFQAAAAQWRRGNKVQANFHLAFARLPRLDGPDDAFHLFSAEQFLFTGFSPALLMQELGFEKSQIALLKFPGQPRVPAGSGKPSGEYSSGQQGDAATVTPVFLDTSRMDETAPREETESATANPPVPQPQAPHPPQFRIGRCRQPRHRRYRPPRSQERRRRLLRLAPPIRQGQCKGQDPHPEARAPAIPLHGTLKARETINGRVPIQGRTRRTAQRIQEPHMKFSDTLT